MIDVLIYLQSSVDRYMNPWSLLATCLARKYAIISRFYCIWYFKNGFQGNERQYFSSQALALSLFHCSMSMVCISNPAALQSSEAGYFNARVPIPGLVPWCNTVIEFSKLVEKPKSLARLLCCNCFCHLLLQILRPSGVSVRTGR